MTMTPDERSDACQARSTMAGLIDTMKRDRALNEVTKRLLMATAELSVMFLDRALGNGARSVEDEPMVKVL